MNTSVLGRFRVGAQLGLNLKLLDTSHINK